MLGKGDVGHVYLVREVLSAEERLTMEPRHFALKVISKADIIKRKKTQRILLERDILAQTDHPFICTLHRAAQTEQRLYFLLQYNAGGEFFLWLKRQKNKRLPEAHARFYAAEILLGLEYLHFMGFIYRDLKPENVLMHASGHVMLADFDLAKKMIMSANTKLAWYGVETSAGGCCPCGNSTARQRPKFHVESQKVNTEHRFQSFVGTVEYIAPEILETSCKDREGYSGSVDWWTFGILLFEMVFGKTPFKGKSQKETFDNIFQGLEKGGEIDIPEDRNVSGVCGLCGVSGVSGWGMGGG